MTKVTFLVKEQNVCVISTCGEKEASDKSYISCKIAKCVCVISTLVKGSK